MCCKSKFLFSSVLIGGSLTNLPAVSNCVDAALVKWVKAFWLHIIASHHQLEFHKTDKQPIITYYYLIKLVLTDKRYIPCFPGMSMQDKHSAKVCLNTQ